MSTLLALAPVAVPVAGAAVHAVAGRRPVWLGTSVTRVGTASVAWVGTASVAWVGAASAAIVLLASVVLAAVVVSTGAAVTMGTLVRVDALSAFMLIVIGAIGLLAGVATPAHLATEIADGRASARTAARYGVLVQLFLAAMAAAVLAADLGVLWVAVEATTIVTAFLVGLRRTRAAVEAAWKYVVICSAGIALALLGVVVLNHAAAHSGTGAGLDWAALVAAAPRLDDGVTRVAVLLLIIGFGAKAGLAPLHAWLPDAHGQAPAPVSALMSGVLLSVAFYAVLRVKAVADLALGPGFARVLLLATALASLVVAASLLLAQRDYKRMLAYSSIEHMGLLALGASAGGAAATGAVLLHVLGHGLVKGVLFLGAGRLLQVTGSSRIDEVRGVAAGHPLLAGCLGLGVLALIGLPPFSIFASELGIARAGFSTGSAAVGWATAAALVLVVVIAAALVGHTSRMLLGNPDDPSAPAPAPGSGTLVGTTTRALPRSTPKSTRAALVGGLLAAAALGITAGPLSALVAAAAATLSGAP
jgi:hydrogenase-4 component F